MLAYFAYPIDVLDHASPGGVRSQVRGAMDISGWQVYEPGIAWRIGATDVEPDPRVQEINNAALDQADIVVALLPVESHSVGVPIEIDRAARVGKPVYVWRQKRSWAIAQSGVYQFATVETLCMAIQRMGRAKSMADERGQEILFDVGGEVGSAKPTFHVEQDDFAYTDAATVFVTGESKTPTRAYPDDAGWDLYVRALTGQFSVAPGQHLEVPCGVSIQWPPGYWGLLVGRSSTFRDKGLVVNPGIIDPGYRGPLFAAVRNISQVEQRITHGDRIAQIIPLPAAPSDWEVERVAELSPSERGTNGFGSTGR